MPPSDPPEYLAIKQHLQSLRDALSQNPPYCDGTVQIPPDQFTLFYGPEGNAHRINLSQASQSQLENLACSCDPATFGVNKKDVLDESYRKARKLDVANFATKFNLEKSGIMDVTRAALLEGHDSNRPVEAELYKLNIYGEGDFFKAHKDTPRSDTMFASLVIIFPTKHEGGALRLRQGSKEWTLNSAASTVQNVISYIGFYSDVEHEVTPVTSGYRVTLTYNLSFSVEPNHLPTTLISASTSETELAVKAIFTRLLSDSNFLPKGGDLGFGLRQEYPLNPENGLGNLIECLKGSDAIIHSVCRQLSLQTSLRVIYKDDRREHFIMVDDVPDFASSHVQTGTISEALQEWKGGERILVTGPVAAGMHQDQGMDDAEDSDDSSAEVTWVTDLTEFTRAKTAYITYGNDASLEYEYGNVCLIVHVGVPGDRTARVEDY